MEINTTTEHENVMMQYASAESVKTQNICTHTSTKTKTHTNKSKLIA